jgi:hypothetical protein
MQKTPLIRSLCLGGVLLLGMGGLRAQSAAILGKAPASREEAAAAEAAYQREQKMARIEAAEVAKAAFASERVLASEAEQTSLRALHAEMEAQAANPAYDMAASVAALRESGLVMYPFEQFVPGFPLIFRSGNEAVDNYRYNQAKLAWKNQQQ